MKQFLCGEKNQSHVISLHCDNKYLDGHLGIFSVCLKSSNETNRKIIIEENGNFVNEINDRHFEIMFSR